MRGNLVTLAGLDALRAARPRRLALVAAPWIFDAGAEFRSQQLGLGFVGAFAESLGHRVVALVDPMLEGGDRIATPIETRTRKTFRHGHPDEWVVSRIPRPVDLIGLGAPFTDSRLTAYPLLSAIKRAFPDTPLVVGGVLATTLPEQVLAQSPADAAVRGEGEVALARLAAGQPWAEIPGLSFRRPDGRVVHNPGPAEQLRHLDELPWPGHAFRPMAEYVAWSPRGDRDRRTVSLVTSRGCPFRCQFCSIPEKNQLWRAFSAGRVKAEIDHAVDRLGANHIEFEDDNFTLDRRRALEILDHVAGLRRRGTPLECSFPNGVMVERLSRELVAAFRAAGVDIVYLPLESGDVRVLRAMGKNGPAGHLDAMARAVGWCREAGILSSAFVIVGYPGGRPPRGRTQVVAPDDLMETDQGFVVRGEDEPSFARTTRFCRELRRAGLGALTPLVATPYPGTELHDICRRQGWLVHSDDPDAIVTVSYAHMRPELVQIQTPWCSAVRAYERWKELVEEFPSFHNVRRWAGQGRLASTPEVGIHP